MDIPIKLKSFEIEALEKLNNESPEVYQGKNQGFYWALHQAAVQKEPIIWQEVASFKLDKSFSGNGFEDNALLVNHLTVADEDYTAVAKIMHNQFSLQRPIQKAYVARNVIKWAIIQQENFRKNSPQSQFTLNNSESEMLLQLTAIILNNISELIRNNDISKLEKIKIIMEDHQSYDK